jgi:5'-nucleotidase / UDP-sugar diphosphatase
VVGGNIMDRTTNTAVALASCGLGLGPRQALVIGVTTDRLATFRAAVRPDLDVRDPVAAARHMLTLVFPDHPLPIVLSHAGLRADREILKFIPDGALFAGAHDHLSFVHRQGRTVYFHSGSWTELISIATSPSRRCGKRPKD